MEHIPRPALLMIPTFISISKINSQGTVVAKRRARKPDHIRPVLPALISNDEGKMKSMMKKISFAAVAFAALMLIAAPVAQATTVSEVQSMVTQLKGKVEIIQISGKQAESKDRPGLLGQLNGVALTLDQGKFCNSITKVRDFQKKVNDMISAGKLNQDPSVGPTGQELLSDGDAIIAALNELQVQSTGSPCSN
jgi:hypothetical protein